MWPISSIYFRLQCFRTDTDISAVGFSADAQFFLVAAAGVQGLIQLYLHKGKSAITDDDDDRDDDEVSASQEQEVREALGKEVEDQFGELKLVNLRQQAKQEWFGNIGWLSDDDCGDGDIDDDDDIHIDSGHEDDCNDDDEDDDDDDHNSSTIEHCVIPQGYIKLLMITNHF